MRFFLLPISLLALVLRPSSAHNAAWSDNAKLTATSFHGPQLSVYGVVTVDTVSTETAAQTFVAKSVMTGYDSFFPNSLPSTLKVPHLVPDSLHPDLAYWYTPDVFEHNSVPDGTKVSEWSNIANICHDKHDQRVGGGFSDLCTTPKVANSQVVAGGNTLFVAKLGQSNIAYQPIYKRNVLNGHGVVRFARGDAFGTTGQYLEMTQRCTNNACSAASTTKGWAADTTGGPGDWTAGGLTAFMVVKTTQSSTDVNPMGIMHLNANAGDRSGAALYSTETRCIPDFYGDSLTAQTIATLPFLYFDSTSASTPVVPSAQPGRYNGFKLKVYGGTADTTLNIRPLSTVCTVTQYLISSTVVTAFAPGVTVVTVKGGAGQLGGITLANTMFLRIGGTALDGTGVDTLAITSAAASGADTAITLAATTVAASAGTPVYLCASATKCVIWTGTCNDWTANALGAGSTTLPNGPFELWQVAASGSIVTGAPNCPEGKIQQFSTYTGYMNTDGKDNAGDNACYTECRANGGCNIRNGDFGSGNTCVQKQGTTRKMHDSNKDFKIVAITINSLRTVMKGYVNGFHEGCDFTQGINSCGGGMIVPPISISGGTAAAAFTLLKFGALALANGVPNENYASMDLAEVMLYKQVLTPEEMDRIGSYLAGKYDIKGFIVNDDIRSPYRTKAVNLPAGCGSSLRQTHRAVVCKGQTTCEHVNAAGPLKHNMISLSSGFADKTDSYYLLMRLTIDGGEDSLDGTVKSAKGQSCVITAYSATGNLATCDFTRSYEFGYVAYGTSTTYPFWNKESAQAVEDGVQVSGSATVCGGAACAVSTDFYVSWAPPDRVVPFVALFGDIGTQGVAGAAAREAVWVTAMSIVGTLYKLTVTRGVGGTTKKWITQAESKSKAAAARLTYPRAIVMSSSGATDVWMVVSSLTNYVVLPTTVGITNWYARISDPRAGNSGAHEVVQVTQANTIMWYVSVNDIVSAAGSQTVELVAVSASYNYEFAILVGDVLRFGTAAVGELVTVTTGAAVTALATNKWVGVVGTFAGAWPAGTPVTLMQRLSVPTPAAIKVVRGRETTTAAATVHTAGMPIDFMYLPQGETASGMAWTKGSGVSTYVLDECDKLATPFDRDRPIQTFTGPGYIKDSGSNYGLGSFTADTLTTGFSQWYQNGLPDSSTAGASGPAAGGQMVIIKGWAMMPFDQNIAWGDTAGESVNGFDITRLQNYLRVTVGQKPSVCNDPTYRRSPCLPSSTPLGETELKCIIVETGAGHCATDWTLPCRCINENCADCGGGMCNTFTTYPANVATYVAQQHFWSRTRKPTIACQVPPTLGASSQDLNLYWHGIKTTLSNWYKPEAPVITSVEPANANYKGGDTITINGYNFGPKIAYAVTNEGDAQTAGVRMSHVEVFGKSFAAKCLKSTYVSDSQILCKVPMLPARKVAMDKNARTVEVGVVVNAEGQRSQQSATSILTYTKVPTYYACEYTSTSEAAKRDCFTCCRSACIVDEFASGGVKGGSTFSHCDAECYSYCGYTTS